MSPRYYLHVHPFEGDFTCNEEPTKEQLDKTEHDLYYSILRFFPDDTVEAYKGKKNGWAQVNHRWTNE